MIHDRIDIEEAYRIAVGGMLENACPGSLIAAEHADMIGADLEEHDPGRPGRWFPGFLSFVNARAFALVHEDARRIADLVDADGYLTVYRSMIVPKAWLDRDHDGLDLGECWAWTEDCAISHHGGIGDGEVRMRGRVHVDDVDWTMTIGLNACDDYAVGTENEIRLRKGDRVVLERLEWREDIFDQFVRYTPQTALKPSL
jgi:hypothetical protein